MNKFNKIIVFMLLISSLQLHSAFHTAKQVTKGLIGAPLTVGTVLFAQLINQDKESAAFHEAGHAVISEHVQPNSTVWASVTKIAPTIYEGILYHENLKNAHQFQSIALAGFAQDLKDKDYFARRNFMEQELGLPLTNISEDPSRQLEVMENDIKYYTDLFYAHNPIHDCAENAKTTRDDIVKNLQETKKLVAQHQKSIHAIAQVLCNEESLSGNPIREIIAQANSKK